MRLPLFMLNPEGPDPDQQPRRWRSLARVAAFGGKLAVVALRVYRAF